MLLEICSKPKLFRTNNYSIILTVLIRHPKSHSSYIRYIYVFVASQRVVCRAPYRNQTLISDLSVSDFFHLLMTISMFLIPNSSTSFPALVILTIDNFTLISIDLLASERQSRLYWVAIGDSQYNKPIWRLGHFCQTVSLS